MNASSSAPCCPVTTEPPSNEMSNVALEDESLETVAAALKPEDLAGYHHHLATITEIRCSIIFLQLEKQLFAGIRALY